MSRDVGHAVSFAGGVGGERQDRCVRVGVAEVELGQPVEREPGIELGPDRPGSPNVLPCRRGGPIGDEYDLVGDFLDMTRQSELQP